MCFESGFRSYNYNTKTNTYLALFFLLVESKFNMQPSILKLGPKVNCMIHIQQVDILCKASVVYRVCLRSEEISIQNGGSTNWPNHIIDKACILCAYGFIECGTVCVQNRGVGKGGGRPPPNRSTIRFFKTPKSV